MLSPLYRGEFTPLLAVVIEAATAPVQPQFDVMHLTDAHWKFLHVITRAWRLWLDELQEITAVKTTAAMQKLLEAPSIG